MVEGREGPGGHEWTPGKATELDDVLAQRRLTPEEIEERRGKRPELRLRPDVPSIDVSEATRAYEILDKLGQDEISGLALRSLNGVVTAMVVPLDRYLELATSDLKGSHNKEATNDGRVIPAEATFAASYVEQVDPNATWT
jgi:hypothetical protein